MPCLITALSELNQPRYMTPGGIFDAYDQEITVWGRADLKDVDDSDLGLKGVLLHRSQKHLTKFVKVQAKKLLLMQQSLLTTSWVN